MRLIPECERRVTQAAEDTGYAKLTAKKASAMLNGSLIKSELTRPLEGCGMSHLHIYVHEVLSLCVWCSISGMGWFAQTVDNTGVGQTRISAIGRLHVSVGDNDYPLIPLT